MGCSVTQGLLTIYMVNRCNYVVKDKPRNWAPECSGQQKQNRSSDLQDNSEADLGQIKIRNLVI